MAETPKVTDKAKKKKPAEQGDAARTLPAPEVTPEKPEGLRLVESLKKAVDDLVARKEAIETEREEANGRLDKEKEAIDDQLREIRSSLNLPEDEEDDDDERTPARRPYTRRGGKNMLEYVFNAFKACGDNGLSRIGMAQAIKKAGFHTTAKSEEVFVNSVYVSGVNKLMKMGLVERFKGDGVSKYRFNAKGKKLKELP
jgi:hypothetical protein